MEPRSRARDRVGSEILHNDHDLPSGDMILDILWMQ